jgi:hypothetical protein
VGTVSAREPEQDTEQSGSIAAQPGSAGPTTIVAQMLALQRTAGNRAVARLVARQQAPAVAAPPPPAAPRTPEEQIVAAAQVPTTPNTAWRPSSQVFNLILHNYFPGPESGWYSGARFDAGQTSVAADIPAAAAPGAPAGQPASGYVMFVLGTQFARDTSAATLTDRVADVQRELLRVLRWRIGLGILTAADIQIPMVNAELRTMQPVSLRRLRAMPRVESAARDAIDQILAISTVVPVDAQFAADGSASLTVGGVTVRILPDTRGGTTNETAIRFVPNTISVPGISFNAQRRVTAINGTLPVPPGVEIQTSYAASGSQAGADPLTATSAYGRGTTTADVAAGNTSLRFHEGSHGADYLAYLASHPYRPFRGAVGMTVTAWNAERTAFLAAHSAWAAGAGAFSLHNTDCVGARTIDDQHRGQAGYRLQCGP